MNSKRCRELWGYLNDVLSYRAYTPIGKDFKNFLFEEIKRDLGPHVHIWEGDGRLAPSLPDGHWWMFFGDDNAV